MKAIDLTGQKFGRLTVLYKTEKRSGHNIMWHCKCDCGKEKDISSQSLRQGKTQSCGCLQKQIVSEIGKKTIQQIAGYNKKNLIGERFGRLLVLEPGENKKNKATWKCKCDCGNITIVSTGDLMSGNTQSCGCLISRGEEKIRTILVQNKIPFTTQQTFENCRYKDTNALARFDFYINNQYLVEFDGQQHYKATNFGWNTEEYLQITKKHDNFKNQWCKDNNIPLIRIPYTHLKQLSLQDLQLNTSKFILK